MTRDPWEEEGGTLNSSGSSRLSRLGRLLLNRNSLTLKDSKTRAPLTLSLEEEEEVMPIP
jgi:hypothetical protein